MKITVVGSGNSWTKHPNSSYLIERDDGGQMLIDIGYGVLKQIDPSVYHASDAPLLNYDSLDTILITHFHEDHFADFYPLFLKICAFCKNKKINVIVPKDTLLEFREKLITLAKIYQKLNFQNIIDQHLNIIECSKEQSEDKSFIIDLHGYNVQPVAVEHIPTVSADGGVTYNQQFLSLGYIIKEKSSKKTVGFSGDTQDCDGLKRIIEASDVVFCDAGSVNKNDGIHLSDEEYLSYKRNNTSKEFYAVHVGGRIHDKYQGQWKENPEPGTVIIVGSEPPTYDVSKSI